MEAGDETVHKLRGFCVFLKIKTQNKQYFLIECEAGVYWIRETTAPYLRDQILGKKCRQPRFEMPLEIYFDQSTTLQTSRVIEIKELQNV